MFSFFKPRTSGRRRPTTLRLEMLEDRLAPSTSTLGLEPVADYPTDQMLTEQRVIEVMPADQKEGEVGDPTGLKDGWAVDAFRDVTGDPPSGVGDPTGLGEGWAVDAFREIAGDPPTEVGDPTGVTDGTVGDPTGLRGGDVDPPNPDRTVGDPFVGDPFVGDPFVGDPFVGDPFTR